MKLSLAGKKIKCPKCGQGLTVPASEGQPTATVSGRIARPTLPEDRSFADRAAELEQQAPIVAEPAALKEVLGKSRLKKFAGQIEKKNGEGKPEAELRRKAILDLAETLDARATALLIGLASDYWISVREAVAEGLGVLRDPQGVPTLIRLLGDEVPDVKRDAVVSLGKVGDARAVRPLLDVALQEPLFRFTAGEAIAKIGKAAVPVLLQILQEDDAGRTLEAIIVLGRIKDPSAAEPIAAMLSHRFTIVRSHAVESLGLIGDPKSATPLIRMLSDPDAIVRAQTAAALQKVGDKRAVPGLLKLLAENDLDVCTRAAATLGELGERQAAPGLLPLLERPEPEVRCAPADALGKIGDEMAAEPLTRLFHDADESVRLKAVSAFRKFRSASAVTPLLLLLDDANVQIRQRAVDALGEIANPAALDRLIVTLRADSATEVRMAAAKALGQFKSAKALKSLEEALDDDLTVRCRAISALGDIGDASSLPALLAMLKDPTPEVRYHASQSLAHIGHQNSRKPLEELLGDENPMVRRGAAKALIQLGDPRGDKLLEDVAKTPSPNRMTLPSLSSVPDWVAGVFFPSSPAGMQLLIGLPVLLLLITGFWFSGSLFKNFFSPPSVLVLRGNVSSLGLTPDGSRLAVGRTAGLLEIWDAKSGSIEMSREIPRTGGEVFGVAFNKDGSSVLLISGNEAYQFSDNQFRALTSLPAPVKFFSWRTGSSSATCFSNNGVASIWDLESAAVQSTFQLPINQPVAFSASGDAGRFAVATYAKTVVLVDTLKAAVHAEVSTGKAAALDLVFTADNSTVVTIDGDNLVTAIDFASAKVTGRTVLDFRIGRADRILCLSNQKSQVLVCQGSRLLTLSIPDMSVIREISTTAGLITSVVAISSDGATIAGGSRDESPVMVMDAVEGKLKATFDQD
ncbi:MAG: HEAT repeat domain-containing protein [Planctomycetaceae bacterium]|nr:HEAT repeat domain-containing protein [Planctomycetaceae bacterium]